MKESKLEGPALVPPRLDGMRLIPVDKLENKNSLKFSSFYSLQNYE